MPSNIYPGTVVGADGQMRMPTSAGATGKSLRISATTGLLEWYTPSTGIVADTLIASLLATAGTTDGQVVTAKGYYVADDGYTMLWRWEAASTQDSDGVDDSHPGLCYLPPGHSGAGRWIAKVDRRKLLAKWFGCKADNTQDDTVYIQKAIDRAININDTFPWESSIVQLPPGVIRTTDTIHIGYGRNSGGASLNSHLTLEGSDKKAGYDSWGTVIAVTFTDRPIINVEGGAGVSIQNLGLRGNLGDPVRVIAAMPAEEAAYDAVFPTHTLRQFAAVSIDAYNTTEPVGTHYSNIPAASAWSDHAKSTDVKLVNCDIRNVGCGIIIRPSGGDGNSEYVEAEYCRFQNCKYAFSVNSSQCRGNRLHKCIVFNCFTAIGIGHHGPSLGHNVYLEGCAIEYCAWWVKSVSSEWSPLIVVRENYGEGCVGLLDMTSSTGFTKIVFEKNTCNFFDGNDAVAAVRYHIRCENNNLTFVNNHIQNESDTKPVILILAGANSIVEDNVFRRDTGADTRLAVIPASAVTVPNYRIARNAGTEELYAQDAYAGAALFNYVAATYIGSRQYSGSFAFGALLNCEAGDHVAVYAVANVTTNPILLFRVVSTTGQYGTTVLEQLNDTTETTPISTATTIAFLGNASTVGWRLNAVQPVVGEALTGPLTGPSATVDIRDSTTAQNLKVYGTYTDASNYVRASLAATSTTATLAAESAGTGAANIDLTITPKGTGGLAVVAGANGQTIAIKTLTELLTIAAAATSTTTIQKPANSIILGVSVRVTVAVTCTSVFEVGDSTSANRFNTASVSKAATSTNVGTKAGAYYNATAEGIIITPDTTPSDATGRVRVTIHYIEITAPTS